MRDMENLLTDLKMKEGCITEWNFELMQTVPDVATMRDDQFYKE